MYLIDEKGMVWRRNGSEIIILNLASGHYYTLNETGQLIWEKVLEQQSPGEIARGLCDAYEVDYETALKDVTECLHHLAAESIIRFSDTVSEAKPDMQLSESRHD